jgi:UDP-N-acetylmuramate--alanine ligase
LVVCTDDPGAARLLQVAQGKGIKTRTYGLTGSPDYHAKGLRPATGGGTVFDFVRGEDLFVKVLLPIPGRHNVQNATAALAVMDLLGHSVREASQAMQVFRGTGRRFQIRGQEAGITVIDDYAHHPTEIQATLQAAREYYPKANIWAVWQPHTFLRTKEFFDAFTQAFGDADHVLVTSIYAAREKGPAEFNGTRIVGAMDHPDVSFAPGFEEAVAQMAPQLGAGDVVLILSAGDADQIGPRLLERLRKNGRAG